MGSAGGGVGPAPDSFPLGGWCTGGERQAVAVRLIVGIVVVVLALGVVALLLPDDLEEDERRRRRLFIADALRRADAHGDYDDAREARRREP